MGLKSLLANSIETAFNVLGASDEDGLQVSIGYYRAVSEGAYNTTTRVKTVNEELNVFDGIKYAARDREIDGIKIKVGFEPNHDDRVVIGGVNFNIVNVFQDPAGVTWNLFIRGV